MRVMVCPDSAWDAQAQTCSAPEWAYQVGLLPPLSISDGLQIAGAILGVWVVGYAVRMIRATVSLR